MDNNREKLISHDDIKPMDIEIFKILSNHYLEYIKLFWTRQNTFLTVNGALLTINILIARVGYESQFIVPFLYLIGMIVCNFWIQSNATTRKWIKTLRNCVFDATKIYDKHNVYLPYFKEVEKTTVQVSGFMQKFPYVFYFSWAVAILLLFIKNIIQFCTTIYPQLGF